MLYKLLFSIKNKNFTKQTRESLIPYFTKLCSKKEILFVVVTQADDKDDYRYQKITLDFTFIGDRSEERYEERYRTPAGITLSRVTGDLGQECLRFDYTYFYNQEMSVDDHIFNALCTFLLVDRELLIRNSYLKKKEEIRVKEVIKKATIDGDYSFEEEIKTDKREVVNKDYFNAGLESYRRVMGVDEVNNHTFPTTQTTIDTTTTNEEEIDSVFAKEIPDYSNKLNEEKQMEKKSNNIVDSDELDEKFSDLSDNTKEYLKTIANMPKYDYDHLQGKSNRAKIRKEENALLNPKVNEVLDEARADLKDPSESNTYLDRLKGALVDYYSENPYELEEYLEQVDTKNISEQDLDSYKEELPESYNKQVEEEKAREFYKEQYENDRSIFLENEDGSITIIDDNSYKSDGTIDVEKNKLKQPLKVDGNTVEFRSVMTPMVDEEAVLSSVKERSAAIIFSENYFSLSGVAEEIENKIEEEIEEPNNEEIEQETQIEEHNNEEIEQETTTNNTTNERSIYKLFGVTTDYGVLLLLIYKDDIYFTVDSIARLLNETPDFIIDYYNRNTPDFILESIVFHLEYGKIRKDSFINFDSLIRILADSTRDFSNSLKDELIENRDYLYKSYLEQTEKYIEEFNAKQQQ